MTTSATLPEPRRRPPRLFWLLLGLAAVFFLVGLLAWGYALYTTHGPAPALWARPWEMPEPERISPGLAVWSLSGVEPDQVYRHAMADDQLDTVAAMTLLTPRLDPEQRLGWIHVLAQRFAKADREADARVFLQDASDLAMLLPGLPDAQRANMLLDVAATWASLGEEEKARWTLEQVLVLAQSSPYLGKSIRKALFVQLGERYTQLGDEARGEAIAAIPVLEEGLLEPNGIALDTLTVPPIRPDSLEALIRQREAAAQAYVEDWSRGGGEAGAGATRTLENALIDEDLGRTVFYDNILAREDIPPNERLQVLFDRVQWRAIRYRAASRLYGASITPSWEAQRLDMGVALRDAIWDLHNQSTVWVASLAEANQPEARVAVDRLVVSWAAIGLYVGANQEVLVEALNQDIAALPRAGVFPRGRIEKDRLRIELFYKPAGEGARPAPAE